MSNTRCPKLALFGYVHEERGREKPKKKWMDTVKTDLRIFINSAYMKLQRWHRTGTREEEAPP